MKGLRYLMLLPLLLLAVSIAVGIENYQDAKEEMRQDLTHALRQLIMNQPQQQLLLDTVSTLHSAGVLTLHDMEDRFRTELSIQPLKDTSHVAVCLMRDDDGELFCEKAQVSSDTLLWSTTLAEHDQAIIALKAFANPSMCSIIAHSDQRLPLAGVTLCLLLLCGLANRKKVSGIRVEMAASPTPSASPDIRLTPMQEQLMNLFDSAPGHTLSKEAICAALWPKKDNPENTLYTFISRLKKTLKDQTDLDIVNKRGREYQLTKRAQPIDNQDC